MGENLTRLTNDIIKRAEQNDHDFSLLWKRLIDKKQHELDRSGQTVPGGAIAKARGTLRSSLIRRKGAKKKGQEEMMEPDKEPPQELDPEEEEELEPQKEQNIEECKLTADVSLLI